LYPPFASKIDDRSFATLARRIERTPGDGLVIAAHVGEKLFGSRWRKIGVPPSVPSGCARAMLRPTTLLSCFSIMFPNPRLKPVAALLQT
jgi:hypothetical protein